MKILLVSPWQEGAAASGVVTACSHLATGLGRHPDVAEVVVLSLSEERSSATLDRGSWRVQLIPRQRRLALATDGWPDYVRAARWVRRSGFAPDVVHGQGVAGEGHVTVRLARRLRVPSVVTVHGMIDKETTLYADATRARLARSVMMRTLAAANGLVFVSPYRKEQLTVARGQATSVIANPIDDEVFALRNAGAGAAILYAGFVGPRKRLADLVRALDVVRRRVPAAELRVAGPVTDADYGRQVQAEIDRLGLGDAVTFLGSLEADDLYAEYASAGVLALPSQEENAPQVVAEALAAGLPVVASRVGGVPWMIDDGSTGAIVEPGDVETLAARIVELLVDPDRRAAVARAGRASAERYRPDRVADDTVRFYRSLAGGERRS